MDADGSGQTRLTDNTRSDGFPMWSPDGQKIAFGGGHEIYVMNPDGTGQTGLTTHLNFYQRGGWGPTWSLDGQHIAFDGDPYDTVIRLVSVNGGPLTFLAFGAHPDWSRTQQKIAFDLNQIYVINEDGSARTRLTNQGGYKPRWRP
jgi:Tol biopolymer transport system component